MLIRSSVDVAQLPHSSRLRKTRNSGKQGGEGEAGGRASQNPGSDFNPCATRAELSFNLPNALPGKLTLASGRNPPPFLSIVRARSKTSLHRLSDLSIMHAISFRREIAREVSRTFRSSREVQAVFSLCGRGWSFDRRHANNVTFYRCSKYRRICLFEWEEEGRNKHVVHLRAKCARQIRYIHM